MLALSIVFILTLIYLSYQDFKSRSVYWIVFPILFALSFYLNFQYYLIEVYLLNLLVIALQIFTILIYLKIRGLKPAELFSKYFGLGDLLFLLVLCISFTLEHFLLFNICTLMFAIVVSYLMKLKTIPFAGIQAAFLSIYIIFNNIIFI